MDTLQKNIQAHVASVIAIFVAALTLWHPGLHPSSAVIASISTAAVAAAGVIQIIVNFFHASTKQKINILQNAIAHTTATQSSSGGTITTTTTTAPASSASATLP